MPAGGKRKSIASITVKDFLDRHGEDLDLSMKDAELGLDRRIEERSVNRPGLALSGFFTYFAKKRIQVFGNSEISYLESLPESVRLERFTQLCQQDFPCLVVARGHELPKNLREIAALENIAVIDSPRPTMSILNAATIRLEEEFAPHTTIHGCMVEYRGVGVLITGKSGAGKSETAIGLLEKGGALIADDTVNLKQVGDTLVASAKDLARGYLEMRGIGIINVANLYGLSAIRSEKFLELVVELKPETDLNKVDRLGINQKTMRILDVDVPLVDIPVAAGRDTARLIGVAALDLQLRKIGYDMADEFNQRLLQQMKSSEPS